MSATQQILGDANVFSRGKYRFGKQDLRVSRKGDHVESVAGIELIQRTTDQLFAFFDGETGH